MQFRSVVRLSYLNLPKAGSVTGSHVLVQGIHSVRSGHLAVLLVHVVGAGARVVSDPDTEVLDLLGALLIDLRGSASCFPAVGSCQVCAPGSGR